MGGAIFAQFFLLTLYMQEVLHYSALHTGLAYIALTLTIIVFSALAQALVTRIGVRLVLPAGLALSAVALVLYARLPVHGSYFSDLLPASAERTPVSAPIDIGTNASARPRPLIRNAGKRSAK